MSYSLHHSSFLLYNSFLLNPCSFLLQVFFLLKLGVVYESVSCEIKQYAIELAEAVLASTPTAGLIEVLKLALLESMFQRKPSFPQRKTLRCTISSKRMRTLLKRRRLATKKRTCQRAASVPSTSRPRRKKFCDWRTYSGASWQPHMLRFHKSVPQEKWFATEDEGIIQGIKDRA